MTDRPARSPIDDHVEEMRFDLAVRRAAYYLAYLGDATDPDVHRVSMVEDAWSDAGFTPTSPIDMPIPFDAGYGPRTGFVVGECLHAVAESEWAAGYRNCERCTRRARVVAS